VVVSCPTIDYASKVLKLGVPEVVSACELGKLAVSRASRLVELPPEDQRKVLSAGRPVTLALAPVRSGKSARVSAGMGFDRLVTRAREVQELIASQLGCAKTLVQSGHFDRAVMLSAVRQLESVAAALTRWSAAARAELGLGADGGAPHSAPAAPGSERRATVTSGR
jgi:hypothetical protein